MSNIWWYFMKRQMRKISIRINYENIQREIGSHDTESVHRIIPYHDKISL